jgi:hypothetical protein
MAEDSPFEEDYKNGAILAAQFARNVLMNTDGSFRLGVELSSSTSCKFPDLGQNTTSAFSGMYAEGSSVLADVTGDPYWRSESVPGFTFSHFAHNSSRMLTTLSAVLHSPTWIGTDGINREGN